MTTTRENTAETNQSNLDSDRPPKQADLGWEGHVHVPTDIPLWRRVLESWPELRTGMAYSLIFGAGVLLGSAVTALVACRPRRAGK